MDATTGFFGKDRGYNRLHLEPASPFNFYASKRVLLCTSNLGPLCVCVRVSARDFWCKWCACTQAAGRHLFLLQGHVLLQSLAHPILVRTRLRVKPGSSAQQHSLCWPEIALLAQRGQSRPKRIHWRHLSAPRPVPPSISTSSRAVLTRMGRADHTMMMCG